MGEKMAITAGSVFKYVALVIAVIVLWTGYTAWYKSYRPKSSFVVRVNADPRINYWWGSIPNEITRAALDTGKLSNIRPGDYVGPQACAECHNRNYENWSEHPHRWMNAPAGQKTIKGDFESADAVINYFGGRGSFYMDDGQYRMLLERGELRRVYEVTQTLGSRFFQYYIGRQLEGPEPISNHLYKLEHVLPFGYWIEYRQWVPIVHVDGTREGEPSVIDDLRRDPYANPDCKEYAVTCSKCHTTLPVGDWLIRNLKKFPPSPRGLEFDVSSYLVESHPELAEAPAGDAVMSNERAEQIFQTIRKLKAPVWEVTSGVSCETCHYGGQFHLEDPEQVMPAFFPVSPHLSVDSKDGAMTLARSAANRNWACARCHYAGRPSFAAGMSTWNSVEFSDAIKGACYKGEGAVKHLTCVHCHEPHTKIGPKWTATPAQDDAKCLQCHEQFEPADQRILHTHHPMGTDGSRCMDCHMPRINEGLQDVVRTHTIFSPTNVEMIEANQPNACNMCHVDKSIDWTVQYLTKWYGATYSEERLASAYGESRSDFSAAIGWIRNWHAPTQMVAVDSLTRAKAEWALPELLKILDSKYMLNRQFAVIGLQRMLNVKLSDFGYQFYMFKDERREPLRKIWAELVNDGSEFPFPKQDEDDLDEWIVYYRQLLSVSPNSVEALNQLGAALLRKDQHDKAIVLFQKVLKIDPANQQAKQNLDVAMKQRTP